MAGRVPGYRFSTFIVSPKRRVVLDGGRELPLIPRYFDLLVLLLERRHEAVHRRDIFDRVWGDVIVSDTALNQAVRTIRRALGDDPREPRFIRTVSRHGYRFVFPGVVETDDEETAAPPPGPPPGGPGTEADYEALIARVTSPARTDADDEEQRDAAEQLHALGTEEALRRLDARPGHAHARALLRDARWESPRAGDVPLLGAPNPIGVAREVIALRLRRAARLVARRWAGAAAGAGIAGAAAGAAGGLLLAALPDSHAPLGLAPVLAVIGGGCGAAAGAGVGAGLAVAEATARSARAIAIVACAALGGGGVGLALQWLGRWALAALVGVHVDIGGGIDGLAIGAAAGAGYALATRRADGLAAPRGRRRLAAALVTAALCGTAGVALTLADRPLAGGTIHAIARASRGSQVTLAPLGRLVGEPGFGPVSRALIGFAESALFGMGLALGLTHISQLRHRTLKT